MLDLLNINTGCISGLLLLLLALAIGHALSDFSLQGDYLSRSKNRHGQAVGELKDGILGNWIYSMSAHSLIHCGAVWLITGSAFLGILEFVLHWLIDFAKCENWTGFGADQLLHYLCKVLYVALIYTGLVVI